MKNEEVNEISNIILELYYAEEITPSNIITEVIKDLENLKQKKHITYKLIKTITKEQEEKLEEEIRNASARWKFKVKSGGNAALALSGKGKLNYINSPILTVRKDNKILKVFPCGEAGIKGSYKGVKDFLKELENIGLSIKKFSEDDLRNLIILKPALIGDNLYVIDIEVKIASAIIDLVLGDQNGNHLLLEFKLNANDKTIGQIARYNYESYSKLMNIPLNKIRKGIVTLNCTGQINEACKENNIELYILRFDNIGYKL